MKYRFRATRAFWRSFGKLSAQQQHRAREAFIIFKQNPFDPRLRSHKIHKLSARYGRTIYAAEIEANLRAVFYVELDVVVTVDIGSHDIYRG
jgi:mRNA-degrading endonuclease YafQ of YafQ-DinJ toxin-antitoxin module